MNDTLTRTRRPGRKRRTDTTAAAVAVVLFASLALMAAPALETPGTIPALDVDNRTPWPLSVEIRPAGRGGWIPIGIAPAGSGTTLTEVPDPGDSWQVRFGYGGVRAVETTSRRQVAGEGWTVSVPKDLVDALRAAKLPDAPPRGT
jgi:hypothetical protein